MKKSTTKDIKEIRAFTTTDGKVHTDRGQARTHQNIINFRKKQYLISKALRLLLDIPNVEDDSKEAKFLEEYYEIAVGSIGSFEDLTDDLMCMVLMKSNSKKWSEIFALVENYAKGVKNEKT
jgi:hypothetical protein